MEMAKNLLHPIFMKIHGSIDLDELTIYRKFIPACFQKKKLWAILYIEFIEKI